MPCRPALLAALLVLLGQSAFADPALTAADQEHAMTAIPSAAGFPVWVSAFRDRARAAGITEATLDAALPGLTFLPDVVEKDRNQAEFTRTIWDYLDRAVSEDRVTLGRRALADHRALLDRIAARYGVTPEVVVAIWGLETNYGGFRGDTPTLSALASLAYDGRRSAFFEGQLLAALQIVQAGEVTVDRMRGSWAGAMGHTQFMPTSFQTLAVDFTGDGRRDIWGDDPADALASTAAYLARNGWIAGQPWGMEVRLPEGFDYALSGEQVTKPVADWQALGLRRADGGDLTGQGPASVILPAGKDGAAFLRLANFAAIESYNPADAYVIAVGHLADRIAGGRPIAAAWPRADRALTGDERRDLQARLTAAGFDTGGVDGKIGPKTLAAVRAFQTSRGMVPDGYASPALLALLPSG
jgi:lytic murein transglycosylase